MASESYSDLLGRWGGVPLGFSFRIRFVAAMVRPVSGIDACREYGFELVHPVVLLF